MAQTYITTLGEEALGRENHYSLLTALDSSDATNKTSKVLRANPDGSLKVSAAITPATSAANVTIVTQAPVNIGASTTTLLASSASGKRRKVTFQNFGATNVHIRKGTGAAINDLIALVPRVGMYEEEIGNDGRIYQGIWTAISVSGTNAVGVIEEDIP